MDTLGEDALGVLLRQSLVGFYVIQDRRLVFLNDRAAEIVGYGRDELLAMETPLEVVAPEDRATVVANVRARLEGKRQSQRYVLNLQRKNGERAHVEVHGFTVERDGRPAIAGVVLDLSEHHRVERAMADSERRFRTVVNNLRDVVLQTDAAGRLTFLNPAWEDNTGFTIDESLGRGLLEFIHPGEREACRGFLDGLLQARDGGGRRDALTLTADGEWRWFALHVQPTIDDAGDVVGLTATLRDIHEDKTVSKVLAESEARLRELTDVLGEGVYVVDAFNRLSFVNPAAERLLGWSKEELLGRNAHGTFHARTPAGRIMPADQCPVVRAAVQGEALQSPEEYFQRKDGGFLPVSLHAAPIRRGEGVAGAVVAFHDISARLASQRALAESEQRYRSLFHGSHEAIFIHALQPDGRPGRFLEVNDPACRRLGYDRATLLTLSPADIDHPDSIADMAVVAEKLLRDGSALFERVHVAADGRQVPVEVNSQVIELDGRKVVLAVARDVSERKKQEERIFRLAHHDPLTDLPNRLLMMDRLALALEQARRFGRLLAVLFIDLDGFKAVNDAHGHAAGDHLLTVIAERLLRSVRKGDTVARLGGDEFLVMLPEIATAGASERVARKIIAAAAQPVPHGARTLHVTASIGIALYPDHGDTSDGLIRRADEAMYCAKNGGRNALAVYQPVMT